MYAMVALGVSIFLLSGLADIFGISSIQDEIFGFPIKWVHLIIATQIYVLWALWQQRI